jgi:beta-lactamase class A
MAIGMVAAAALFTSQGPAELSALAQRAVDAAVARFKEKDVKADQLGISIARLDRANGSYVSGSYRGDQPMYPASVVKMFFLAHLHEELARKRVRMNPELERATKDMIVESSNDATALVLDTVTKTTGGPELPPGQLTEWMNRRQAVNRWFKSLGYTGVNASQKTWNEGPYGRERQGYGPNWELRNSLTPDACLRLMSEIALDKIVSSERCAEMRGLMARSILAEDKKADYQSRSFTGKVLPAGTKLWSKAGYTSTVRHDVAYVKTAAGQEIVLAIFTKSQSNTPDLIPFLAAELLRGLGVEAVAPVGSGSE